MIDLTPVFLAVIALCSVIASAVIVPLLHEKLGTERTAEFLSWVRIAVEAAEQLYKSADGPTKKERVIAFLRSHGFDVDTQEADKAIEAAVYQLKHPEGGPSNGNG